MPTTYEPLATTTLTTTATNYEFTSIPGTYTDLLLVASVRVTTTGYSDYIQFNGDTGNNYSVTILAGNGTSAVSTRYSTFSTPYINWYGVAPSAANTFNVCNIHIMNYSNTTTNKTFISRSNEAGTGTDAIVGLWRSTSAITSLKYIQGQNTLASGTTLTLYGIKAA